MYLTTSFNHVSKAMATVVLISNARVEAKSSPLFNVIPTNSSSPIVPLSTQLNAHSCRKISNQIGRIIKNFNIKCANPQTKKCEKLIDRLHDTIHLNDANCAQPADESKHVLPHISATSLKAHLAFIASDALQGRKIETPGIELAADYIAAEFRSAGLKPLGVNKSYFQNTTFARNFYSEGKLKSRNVLGLLPGSDLAETYVIVSAHYDHLGIIENSDSHTSNKNEGGDQIFNGANDNGSGTVALLQLASSLSNLKEPPRRSIIFAAFTGEENGLGGSGYYEDHPLVPLNKTVAVLNIEQIGRTDDVEDGLQIKRATLTGFDYSELGTIMQAAGNETGVTVYKHPTKSDEYFSSSDNKYFAYHAIPSHTIAVTFEFSDYHGIGDSWEKIDYYNMEHIVQTIGRGLLHIANNASVPQWNSTSPKAQYYVEFAKKYHPQLFNNF
ncbi:MAG: M28 family peptidase [Pseudomonadota bacterium]